MSDKSRPITISSSKTTVTSTTTTNKYLLDHIDKRIRSLQKEVENILQYEKSLSQGKCLSKEEEEVLSTKSSICNCIVVLETLVAPFKPSLQGKLFSNPAPVIASTSDRAVGCCPYQDMPSMNDNTSMKIVDQVEPGDKERYLCVSDGFTICCLDLKQSQDDPNACSGMQKIPTKISTINLLAEGFPFSWGLFRSGSHAYMVGGQEFPGFKDSDLLNLKVLHSDLEVFSFLYEKYGFNGDSSGKIYLLTLLADGSLSLSKHGNIKPSNKPKSWPVVEKIDDHIHVIESLPSLDRLEIPSHEVIDLNDPSGDWIERSPVRFPGAGGIYIWNHIVVGHRIYASDSRFAFHNEFVVFDSETNKWENHMYPQRGLGRIYIKHVAEILQFGFGRCIGQFPCGDSKDPLYVVLVICPDEKVDMMMMAAIAYLVTEAGQVLCFQRLNRFFEGFDFKESVFATEGTVICGGEQGKTMCAILRGNDTNTLFITTFSWKEVDDALELVSGLLPGKRRVEDDVEKGKDGDGADELTFIEEVDFVEVVGKGWYVSQFGTGLQSVVNVDRVPARLCACFL